MNGNQKRIYGLIPTRVSPIHRYTICPVCQEHFRTRRRGQHAMAAAAIVRGMLIRHLNARHPDDR
jgi:hypothetical protein